MSGVKGRSGGARPGSGPKPKPPAPPIEPQESPLDFLIATMNDVRQDPKLRVRAAVAAAQYLHTKTHDGGKKEAAAERAAKAASGRFAPPAPPKLVVSNG